ncbi:MAG: hypothetical protein HS113_28405 [Verrucomicrobiales bacterium]|nr:hypothetical protein [Verrucomicrobiales bacterium]
MKRADLEHTIRAAGNIADAPRLVIIGSQAILGSFPDAPTELTASAEADTYPFDAPEKADLIDGSIGEKSPFHETFGYYAHGVGPDTAMLRHGLVDPEHIQRVFGELTEARLQHIRPRLTRCQAELLR